MKSELTRRLLTAAVGVPLLLLVLFLFDGVLIAPLLVVVVCLLLWEISGLFNFNRYRQVYRAGYTLIGAVALLGLMAGYMYVRSFTDPPASGESDIFMTGLAWFRFLVISSLVFGLVVMGSLFVYEASLRMEVTGGDSIEPIVDWSSTKQRLLLLALVSLLGYWMYQNWYLDPLEPLTTTLFSSLLLVAVLSIFIYSSRRVSKRSDASELRMSSQRIVGIAVPFWLFVSVVLGVALLCLYHSNGPAGLVWILAICWGTDTAAYFVGKYWGKTRIFPNISPKKTVAGTVGGFVVGALLTAMYLEFYAFMILDYTIPILMVLIPVSAIFGDLVASAFKRLMDTKDSSSLLPGHGGLLDRLDSVIWAPCFLVLISACVSVN